MSHSVLELQLETEVAAFNKLQKGNLAFDALSYCPKGGRRMFVGP
jgi:hypothetical protein